MADSPSYTNYQINASTLNIMKEASGNYMPDYGHWRMRFGEGDIPDRDPEPDPEPEPEPKHYLDPEAETDIDIEPGEPGSPAEGEWQYEEGSLPSYDQAWESNTDGINDMYDSKEDYIKDIEDQKAMAAAGDFESIAEKKGISLDQAKQDWELREVDGRWVWVETKAATQGTQGSVTATANASAGNQTSSSTQSAYLKRSPYKQTNEPNIPQAVGPGGFQPRDPNDINILKSARAAQTNRQSISSTHIHYQGTQVMKDLKANLWNVGEDDNTKKKNRNKAHVIMQQLSHGAQGLLGPNGAIAQFGKSIDENLISDGFRHGKIMAKVLNAGPDIKLGITPENTMIFQVPTGEINPDTGQPEYMALGKSDIEDLHKRSIIQYPFGKQVKAGLDAVAADGRAGKRFDEDKVRAATRQMFKNLGSHGLASVMGDRGIFATPGDQPLMSLALEGMEADSASAFTSKAQDVDHWDLIYEATQTQEGEQGLIEIGIDGIVEMARREYKPNYAEFEANNKSKNPTADMSFEEKYNFYKKGNA